MQTKQRDKTIARRPAPHGVPNAGNNRRKPLATAVLFALAAPVLAADAFTGLGDFSVAPDMWNSFALGISADGTVAVGQAGRGSTPGSHAFRWTSAGGMEDLGTLGGSTSLSAGASSNGSAVAGWSNVTGDAYYRAFIWTRTGGMQDLGTLGGIYSSASSISSDGNVVAGWANVGSGAIHAFRWTAGDGTMHDLGTLGGTNSDARSVSLDGSVVVGHSQIAGNVANHAFRWTVSGGIMHDLGTLGGIDSYASGVSANGAVVVGYGTTATGASHAFRWTDSDGILHDLGTLNGGTDSYANGVSGDGKVVVGTADDSNGIDTAFRWTQSSGMQSVTQWLANGRVAVAPGWNLSHATATNGDGSVVVGFGTNASGRTEAWIARANSGVILPREYVPTLARIGNVPGLGTGLASLTLFGVHHRPLMDDGLPAGSCFWATADGSRSDTRDTEQRLAEAGVCHDFADGRWRIGAGVGTSYARRGLEDGGAGRYSGRYLYAEADYAPESRSWIGSLSALYGAWDTSIKRGYLNAGLEDKSAGTPDASLWSLRARLDWKDAGKLGPFGVSPFAAVTHAESRLEAYTETGGGFPARFDAQTWRSDEVRLGAVLQKALSAATDLRINLEAAHRLDDSGPGVSGRVLGSIPGLDAFAYTGAKVKNSWGRTMVEVDHRLSDRSLVSANINAASSGEDPTWGVSIGYKRAF